MRRIVFLLCLLVVAAGCGGGARRTATQSRLPRDLAHSWARQADAVAQAVAAGDACRANGLALRLQSDVIAGRASVPARYRAALLGSVSRLVGGMSCPPTTTVTSVVTTAPPPKGPPKHGHGPGPPGYGHGHGHGGDGGGDQGGDGG